MATTTNYSWETPDDTDLVKDGAAAIRTLGSSIDTTTKALNPSTTLGDIEYRSSTANTNTRLAIGTTGQILTVSGGVPSWATPATGSGFSPNLIINGAFLINQRGYTSGTNLSSGSYGFDRWKSTFTSTSLTYTDGVNNTVVTISSGGSIKQVIERQNVPAGTYTLSWSGTATARVYNAGGTPPSYAASPITFTADGSANVEVEFTASGGSQTLSLIKFERGSTATTYSFAGGTIQGELAACQRYFQILKNGATGVASSSTNFRMCFVYPVVMRTAPSVAATAAIRISDIISSAYTQSSANITVGEVTIEGGTFDLANFSGMTSGRFATLVFISSGTIQLSAEL